VPRPVQPACSLAPGVCTVPSPRRGPKIERWGGGDAEKERMMETRAARGWWSWAAQEPRGA
jgi:hypothetical protein